MRRLLLIMASLGLGGLIAGEGALRIMGFGDPPLAKLDDVVEYVLIPDSYRRFGNRIDINEDGLRANAFSQTDHPRVLIIGDSVIYGNHFLDQSETVAAQMTDALGAEQSLSGCHPLALPVAISSWGPVNQAAYLERHGTFEADAALIVVSGHDLYDTPTFSSNVVPYRLTPSYTALGDALRAVWQRRAGAQPHPDPAVSNIERAAMSLGALTAMATQLRAADVALFLVYHPTIPERQGTPRDAQATFEDWAQRMGIAFVDLGQALPEPGDYRDRIHPDVEGAARLAKVLAMTVRGALGGC